MWIREFEDEDYNVKVFERDACKAKLAAKLSQNVADQAIDQEVLETHDVEVMESQSWLEHLESLVDEHPVTLINNLDDKLGVLSIAEDMYSLLQRFVAAYDWGSDEPIDGADLVDYAAEWVEQVKMVMAKAEA